MTSHRPETKKRNPLPHRPVLGFSAWQLFVGYLAVNYSPDALLKLQAYCAGNGSILWAASISWGGNKELVRDLDSLGESLTALWYKVIQLRPEMAKSESELSSPIGYGENEWLDEKTQSVLQRIVDVSHDSFSDDWLLIIIYQPSQVRNMRIQMRLLANANQIRVGGRGDNLLNAGHNLFDNAVQYYVSE